MHNQDPHMYTVRECMGITDPGTDRVQQRNHKLPQKNRIESIAKSNLMPITFSFPPTDDGEDTLGDKE